MSTYIEQHNETLFTVTLDSTYSILTTVTSSSADVDRWIAGVLRTYHQQFRRGALVAGLDVEWRPNFSPGGQRNPVALLQLCVGHHCLVFQILRADVAVPYSLWEFLNSCQVTFVGVGIAEDAEKLAGDHNVGVGAWADLREMAESGTGRRDMRQKGLAALAWELMGVAVNKPQWVRMSRWDDEYLSLDQIKYACVDAFLSFELGRILRQDPPYY